ncbi:hypothetical protein [Gimesia aquarii]|uniref:hypothetical protein n=1 Tax=Gimesia aquarii TaxID=2527964 RepID=UPI0011A6D128|nr:hypothetical protein [Gimesia aquarii]
MSFELPQWQKIPEKIARRWTQGGDAMLGWEVKQVWSGSRLDSVQPKWGIPNQGIIWCTHRINR